MPRGKTKREMDAELKEFRNPSPITLDDALACDQPVYEIVRRLVVNKDCLPLTDVERNLCFASKFQGDAFNGGFHQAFSNSTGEHFPLVLKIAKDYGHDKIVEILEEVQALFSGGKIPTDIDQRNDLLDEIVDIEAFDPEVDEDPFESLDRRFYKCSEEYNTGLLNYIKKHKSEFKFFNGSNPDEE